MTSTPDSPNGAKKKRYQGDRTIDGIVVLVDGRPLDPRLDICRFSDNGFEWTYVGAEPRQLALALLAEHLDDPARARQLCEPFMHAVVAGLDNTWQLDSDDIDAALQRIDSRGAEQTPPCRRP